MNAGMFGFPEGLKARFVVSEYDTDSTHIRSPNCKAIFIEMCGGGGGGGSGVVNGAAGSGGGAGLYWSGWVTPTNFGETANIDIGAGGPANTDGSATILTNNTTNTIFAQVNGGRTNNRNGFTLLGNTASDCFGAGGVVNGGVGRHGGFGGGGGGGGHNGSTLGSAGGRPCSLIMGGTVAASGNGAVGNNNAPGSNGTVRIRGFGEGGGGGGRGNGLAYNGGNGANGGGGGGGGGADLTTAGTGGTGGNGFVRIVEVCYA